jgi:tetratricopeptide (TPR) repeat protein
MQTPFKAAALLVVIVTLSVRAAPTDVATALKTNDLGRLETQLSSVQQRFEEGQINEYELRNSFRPFYDLDAVAQERLRAWAASSPRSYVAHLGLGVLYRRLGANARGTEYLSNTPRAQIDEMNRYYDLAARELATSMTLTRKPYLSIFHLLPIYLARGKRNDGEELLRRADTMLPTNALVRTRYATYLLPRWGGSYELVDQYIAACASQKVPESVVLQLKAIKLDDIGLVLYEKGDRAAATKQFEAALQLGHRVGGTFTSEFLGSSTHVLCRGPSPFSLCP